MPRSTRRAFLKKGAWALGASAGLIGGDALLWEPNRPKVVTLEIHLSRLPSSWDGLRIVQLSDIHYDDHFSVIPLRKAIPIVNSLHPDLLVLTGDFVTTPAFHSHRRGHPSARHADPCSLLLREIQAPLGRFAVMGNHDASSDANKITETLQARDIRVLRNDSIVLEKEGKRLWLAGIDDILEGDPDLHATLAKVPPNECTILLAHEPDFATHVSGFPVDLQLSGHSHGGQVRLPFVGATVLPNLGRRFPKGFYQVGNLALYTNVGLGTIALPIRWNCPPEITLFTLRSAA